MNTAPNSGINIRIFETSVTLSPSYTFKMATDDVYIPKGKKYEQKNEGKYIQVHSTEPQEENHLQQFFFQLESSFFLTVFRIIIGT